MAYMSYGVAYPPSSFEPVFRNTFHPFVVFHMGADGQPSWHYQPSGTQTHVKVGIPVDNPNNFEYIYPSTEDPDKYVVISQVNVDTPLMIHFTDDFIAFGKGRAQLFQIPMNIVRNGAPVQLNYVFVAMKPSNTRKYDYAWPASFSDVTGDAAALYPTFPDLITRLYTTQPSFCTDQFLGEFNALGNPVKTPVIGEVITNLVNVNPSQIWCITMDTTGVPVVLSRDASFVVSANIPNASPNFGYFVPGSSPGNYKLVSFSNDFVYLTDEVRAWLNENHVIATTNGLLVTGWIFPSNVVRFTQKPGPERDVTNIKLWVQGNTDAFARLLECDPVLVQALHDAFQTLDPNTIPSLADNDNPLPTVAPAVTPTIIYTRSMYLASLLFVNRTITQLEGEIADEQKLAVQLSSEGDCAALKTSLEAFVTERSAEISAKLAMLIARRDELKALILENDRALRANGDLASFVAAPATVAVSNSILQLRDGVYDAVNFLRTHARISSTGASIYLLNHTQL